MDPEVLPGTMKDKSLLVSKSCRRQGTRQAGKYGRLTRETGRQAGRQAGNMSGMVRNTSNNLTEKMWKRANIYIYTVGSGAR